MRRAQPPVQCERHRTRNEQTCATWSQERFRAAECTDIWVHALPIQSTARRAPPICQLVQRPPSTHDAQGGHTGRDLPRPPSDLSLPTSRTAGTLAARHTVCQAPRAHPWSVRPTAGIACRVPLGPKTSADCHPASRGVEDEPRRCLSRWRSAPTDDRPRPATELSMNNVSRQTCRTVLGVAGPFVWTIAANPSLCLRIERNSLDQDTSSVCECATGNVRLARDPVVEFPAPQQGCGQLAQGLESPPKRDSYGDTRQRSPCPRRPSRRAVHRPHSLVTLCRKPSRSRRPS